MATTVGVQTRAAAARKRTASAADLAPEPPRADGAGGGCGQFCLHVYINGRPLDAVDAVEAVDVVVVNRAPGAGCALPPPPAAASRAAKRLRFRRPRSPMEDDIDIDGDYSESGSGSGSGSGSDVELAADGAAIPIVTDDDDDDDDASPSAPGMPDIPESAFATAGAPMPRQKIIEAWGFHKPAMYARQVAGEPFAAIMKSDFYHAFVRDRVLGILDQIGKSNADCIAFRALFMCAMEEDRGRFKVTPFRDDDGEPDTCCACGLDREITAMLEMNCPGNSAPATAPATAGMDLSNRGHWRIGYLGSDCAARLLAISKVYACLRRAASGAADTYSKFIRDSGFAVRGLPSFDVLEATLMAAQARNRTVTNKYARGYRRYSHE